MKRLHLIVAGLVSGVLLSGHPAQAADVQKDDFYHYARKSAELYRGQLLTKGEIALLADEMSRQTRRMSALPPSLLRSLKENPYDVELTAWMLRWLDGEYNARGRTEQISKARLKALKVRLEKHYEVLTQLAETYQS